MMIKHSIIFSSLLVSASCQQPTENNTDSGVNPSQSCTYPNSSNEFTWRVDTVGWFPTTIGGLHAFSDSDAYVMGYLAQGPKDDPQEALHWDGTSWKKVIFKNPIQEVGHYSYDATGDDNFMVSVGEWAMYPNSKCGLSEFDNSTKKWKGYQFNTEGPLYDVWTDGQGFFIAGGEHGSMYIKDSRNASWRFVQAPLVEGDWNGGVTKINGISKNEMYIKLRYYTNSESIDQYWKYDLVTWTKLFDTSDSVQGDFFGIKPEPVRSFSVSWVHCSMSDERKIYVNIVPNGSFPSPNLRIYKSKLGDSKLQRLNDDIIYDHLPSNIFSFNVLTPNDIWMWGYSLYHWNGESMKAVSIPSIPDFKGETQLRRIKKSVNGKKVWIRHSLSSQVWVVAQSLN